jgi:Ca2+-transporting ATPase
VVVAILGILMAVGALLVLEFAQPIAGVSAVVAGTMALTTFTVFNVFTGLAARDETKSMFNRDILEDRRQLALFGLTVILTFLVTQVGFMQRIFHTAALTLGQWLVCIGVAATVIVVDEAIKFLLRRSRRATDGRSSAGSPVTVTGKSESNRADVVDHADVAPAS